MQTEPLGACSGPKRRKAPTPENSGGCAYCAADADGLDARLGEPTCADCAGRPIVITDGGQHELPPEDIHNLSDRTEREAAAVIASRRQADALERIATAQEYQTDALAVLAGAVAELAHDEMPGRHSPESAVMEWQTWLDSHRRQFDRRVGR